MVLRRFMISLRSLFDKVFPALSSLLRRSVIFTVSTNSPECPKISTGCDTSGRLYGRFRRRNILFFKLVL